MRSLLAVIACLFLATTAMAQSQFDGACLDQGEIAGQSLEAHWTNSFSLFWDAHQAELSQHQSNLVQQAIGFGTSRNLKLNLPLSIHTMKGLLIDARELLTADQFSEILARMGPGTQQALADIGVIHHKEIACSCTTGGSGCPEGFPCTVGCTTWGTGEWNGICVRQQVGQQ